MLIESIVYGESIAQVKKLLFVHEIDNKLGELSKGRLIGR